MVTVDPPEPILLLLPSLAVTVKTCVEEPFAVILAEVGVNVDAAAFGVLNVVVIVGDVPVIAEVVAVIVVDVDATVCVVNTTVAIPLPLVVEVAEAKLPLAFDLVQVTVCPEVLTGLLFASANCAEIVTVLPETGEYAEEVTMYFDAAPAFTTVLAPVLAVNVAA
ncbi:hypothetical protein AQAU111925_10600 [Aquirufa aurantiipilula]